MRSKWVAALMAAAALVPGMAVAQDRGGGRPQGGWQQRQGNPGGGWQRPAPQAQPGGAPQQRQNNGGNRNWQRPAQPSGGWQQRAQAPRTEAGRDFRQERRDDRRAFSAERQRDRQALAAGTVTRDAYRADRNRDVQAFRQDRRDDRRDFTRDRRNEAQRGWARSGADWNDHYRDQARRADWNQQRRWYGGNDRRDWRGYGQGGWNRDWRNDRRYDWNSWRYTNRNAFRLPRYYAPYGWNRGYQRFGVGAVLSSMLFAQSYWINDPWAYRLPDAYDDYRWVRYYNDALLVDVYSGEVVDVIHDIFW